MTALVNDGLVPPSFSYQAIVLSLNDPETRSISPSPSISPALTDHAPSALVTISAAVNVGKESVAVVA